MKILVFSSKFPPDIGGVETVVKNLVDQFSKKHEVKVITTFNARAQFPSKIQKLKNLLKVSSVQHGTSVHISRVFMSLPRSILGFVLFFYRFPVACLKMRNEILRFSPDVINFHFPDDSLYYYYFSTLGLNVPLVVNIHGNELHLFSKGTIYRFFLKKVLKKADWVVINSKYMKSVLKKTYPEYIFKSHIIRNGVNPVKVNNKNLGKYYLYVGRLDAKKGVDVLVKAYNKVSKKISRPLIIIGGESGESSHGALSSSYLKSLATSPKIQFLGKLEFSEVKEYYKDAYYTVFPSRYEPFGIVALESFQYGVPVIASSGGFKEIIKKTNAGITFKVDDVTELSKILVKVDESEKTRNKLAKSALENIKHYYWFDISKDYIDLFTS